MVQKTGKLTVPAALPEATVHSIPSKTTYSGPARVRSYFQPSADADQQKLDDAKQDGNAYGVPQKAAFRGRTLRGAEVTLPEGFSGSSVSVFVSGHVLSVSFCLG